MADQYLATETAAKLHFFLVSDADGLTPDTDEAGNQPQISINGGAWQNPAAVGNLNHIGNGHYYADIDLSALSLSVGDRLSGRYKGTGAAEAPSLNIIHVYQDLLLSKAGYALSAAGVDLVEVENTDQSYNLRQAVAIIAAATAGVLSGAASTSILIKALGSVATDRISATVDADGNRTAVTPTPPA